VMRRGGEMGAFEVAEGGGQGDHCSLAVLLERIWSKLAFQSRVWIYLERERRDTEGV
jgi:hypothetical protein